MKKLSLKKTDVSNKALLKAIVYVTETMATKDDLLELKVRMATTKHIESIKDDLDSIANDMETLSGEVSFLRSEMVTKDRLEIAKEEIVEKFQPLEEAFDKDAEVIVDYEKRISRIEKHLAVK